MNTMFSCCSHFRPTSLSFVVALWAQIYWRSRSEEARLSATTGERDENETTSANVDATTTATSATTTSTTATSTTNNNDDDGDATTTTSTTKKADDAVSISINLD